jgi:hypothetical protein
LKDSPPVFLLSAEALDNMSAKNVAQTVTRFLAESYGASVHLPEMFLFTLRATAMAVDSWHLTGVGPTLAMALAWRCTCDQKSGRAAGVRKKTTI